MLLKRAKIVAFFFRNTTGLNNSFIVIENNFKILR